MGKNVIVVGGGIAGLAASTYLARAGHRVTIFEKKRHLGGRAITQLRHAYRFNLGPHSFFRSGAGAAVLRELGVATRGGQPRLRGLALRGNDQYTLPTGILPMLFTRLLPLRAKNEASKLLVRIRRIDPRKLDAITAAQWLDRNVTNSDVRTLLEALLRFATYSDRHDLQSARSALRQLKAALRGIVYLDEGWQKIVDSLHSSAVAAGVNFVTSSRIVAVHHDGAVRSVELGGFELDDTMDTQSLALPETIGSDEHGTRFPCDTLLLAVDPETTRELVPDLALPRVTPVTATCLDVALSRLPNPKHSFALGIDSPHYFGVHSRWAQLTPKGGALIHVARYGNGSEDELSALLDRLQPGWREVLVHKRYLPSMTVSNAIRDVDVTPAAATTAVKGLFLAGDWVGDDGILSDAALTSARAAAQAIIASA
jgi:phytoene dehydrogenase-like protein